MTTALGTGKETMNYLLRAERRRRFLMCGAETQLSHIVILFRNIMFSVVFLS